MTLRLALTNTDSIFSSPSQTLTMNNDKIQNDEELPLSLTLGPTPTSYQPSLRLAPPSPSPDLITSYQQYLMFMSSSQPQQQIQRSIQIPVRSVRNNRNKTEKILQPPYPWATSVRGRIQTLEELERNRIDVITGDVQCKHCEKVYKVSYNLRERFEVVENVFVTRKRIMRERAPVQWTNPVPVRCDYCGRDKAVKPVIAERKSKINWLFLLLGQNLGYCTLEQLKNFCKHCNSHRTGAKDRVLYLTYLGLCKMLQPNRELFNVDGALKR